MTEDASRRIEWIDAAKGLSILLVTLLHVSQLSAAAGLSVDAFVRLNAYLTPVRMPLFFAAAGVFAGAMLAKPWQAVITKRVSLYLYLFLLWTVMRWLFFAFVIKNPASPAEGSSAFDVLKAVIMPVTGLWFLWSLAIFFVVAKVIHSIGPRASVALAITITIFALGTAAKNKGLMPHNLAHRNTITYFAFFYTAAVFPTLILSLEKIRPMLSAIGFAFVFVICLYLSKNVDGVIPAGILLLFSSLTGVAALFQLARILDNWKIAKPVMRHIGQNTLPIYVTQVPLISVYVLILTFFNGQNWGTLANIFMPIGVLLVVWVALFLHRTFLAFGLKWLYALPAQRFSVRAPYLKSEA